MSTEALERAIAATKKTLAQVSANQLTDKTPCAEWNVSGLINHIVGGQYFFAGAAAGEAPGEDSPDFSAGDYVAAFEEGSSKCVAAFQVPGAMEKMFTLPFGTMPGVAFAGLAAMDTFTHGWDLARATGQNTDLDPELSKQLLEGAKTNISDAIRNEQGSPFGFVQSAPAGSTAADELAAYLGRSV